ncbi:hypothetical protein VTL71DRAFT_13262 [Oculimacula yallundae]|uniref:Amidase domain-containing protein n=1 Tax=Oculimacula yallundae TaxID=86028 RepID=A0ABR4CLB7_9HELO
MKNRPLLLDSMSSADSLDEEEEITVGEVRYHLVPNPQNFLHAFSGLQKIPALVLVYVTTPKHAVSRATLRDFRSNTLDYDDVFQPAFCHTVVFYGSKKEDTIIEPDALDELEAWKAKDQVFIAGNTASVAPGPDGRIIVPSRCYYKQTEAQPLHGARIGVKDNIDIAGHKTSLCNRFIVDAGAIIVGKLKLQAMFNREEPLECVEFTAPFNPRGDGYQVPSGSSHASGAAIAAYDWLDFSLGSDTNGSSRKPASYNGCFQIRPSTGILNGNGVVGMFPQFDMPAFLAEIFPSLPTSYLYGMEALLCFTAIEILYPSDYLPTPNPAQTRLLDIFVSGLESALNVKRKHISLKELWKKDCPDGPQHADVAEYLRFAGIYPFYHDAYHATSDFRKGFEEKHGKPPFVHRCIQWTWEVGKSISRAERDECWRRDEIYRHWLLERIFKADCQDSISIMVLPIEVGQPVYRDAPVTPYGLLSGYDALNMSPIMRAPEVTAPVGEIPYDSIVSQRKKPLPIAASVIGAPGTDLIIAELARKGMEAAGLPTQVRTGRSIYEEKDWENLVGLNM